MVKHEVRGPRAALAFSFLQQTRFPSSPREARRLPLLSASLLILGDRVPPRECVCAVKVSQKKMKRHGVGSLRVELPPTEANSPDRKQTLRFFKAKG